MDSATMSFNGNGRRFSKTEAANVHQLMNLVAKYAAESTFWWEAGQGEPVDKDERPETDRYREHRRDERLRPPNVIEDPRSKVIRISATSH